MHVGAVMASHAVLDILFIYGKTREKNTTRAEKRRNDYEDMKVRCFLYDPVESPSKEQIQDMIVSAKAIGAKVMIITWVSSSLSEMQRIGDDVQLLLDKLQVVSSTKK